jgi:hypothetical protein
MVRGGGGKQSRGGRGRGRKRVTCLEEALCAFPTQPSQKFLKIFSLCDLRK